MPQPGRGYVKMAGPPRPASPVGLLALLLLLLAVHVHAVPGSAPVSLNPVQASVMARLQADAAAASAAATPLVLAAFDDPEFRRMLQQALPPGTSTLDPAAPAAVLLERFRLEVAVAGAKIGLNLAQIDRLFSS